jgi:hypothetical protein
MKEKYPITGYYGCACHPYESFEDLKFYERQKLTEGQIVKIRHTEKFAYVINKYTDGGNYYRVNVFPCKYASDIEQAHGSNLITEAKMSAVDLAYIASGTPKIKNQKAIDLFLK